MYCPLAHYLTSAAAGGGDVPDTAVPAAQVPEWAILCRANGTPTGGAHPADLNANYPATVREWLAAGKPCTIPRAVWLALIHQPPVTTTQVNVCIVKPATKGKGGCYALTVLQHEDRSAVGLPNLFASHAWRYTFESFVAAVLAAVDKLRLEDGADSTYFVWNDIFVEDQNSTLSKPEGYFFNVSCDSVFVVVVFFVVGV